MPPSLKGTTIVLGISGGIAAYKCCELTRLLVKEGAAVHVVLTKAGAQFVTPLTLQTLSGHPVHTDMFCLTREEEIGHIALADRADIVLVAPATADLLAKTSAGICDELLTAIICATRAPVVFAPSMNARMWENPITQENIARLRKLGYRFIEPAAGALACGSEGTGRLPEPIDIVEEIRKVSRKTTLRERKRNTP